MKADEREVRVARQVGAALRRLRERRGLRQYVLADLAGIRQNTLSRYEHAHQCPNVKTLTRLLVALDCSAEEFGRLVGPWGCLRA